MLSVSVLAGPADVPEILTGRFPRLACRRRDSMRVMSLKAILVEPCLQAMGLVVTAADKCERRRASNADVDMAGMAALLDFAA